MVNSFLCHIVFYFYYDATRVNIVCSVLLVLFTPSNSVLFLFHIIMDFELKMC
jgi:hypothetical protein